MSEIERQDERLESPTDESDDTYYIEDDLTTVGHLTACNKCGHKILIEMALIGSQHHVGVTATCGDCLVVPEQFRKEHPEAVSKVEKWLQRGRAAKQIES